MMIKHLRRYSLNQNKALEPYIRRFLAIITTTTYITSFLLIVVVVYEYGFRTTEQQDDTIQTIYNIVWVSFFVDITLRLFLRYTRFTNQNYRKLAWILSVFVYMALLPVIFPGLIDNPFFSPLWRILATNTYNHIVLLLLSFLNLSSGLVRLLGKKTNPSLILAVSFLVFIIIGTVLLMMPRCTVNGISWVDSMFIATSAVCITGLSSVDFVSTFTTEGMVIVIVLVQIGGLGIMTLTSFFALFFMGNTSLYSQLIVRDIVNSSSINSLFSTLLYILAFTLVIEVAGMFSIWWAIHGTLNTSIENEIIFSAFHSIASFCNAGFSALPGGFANPLVVHNNPLLLVISLLVVLGGIGFPVLVNLKNVIVYYTLRLWYSVFPRHKGKNRLLHLYNLNTRIALTTTLLLFTLTTFFFAYFEWNNVFSGMDWTGKWTHAFFNAVCPRSGGFSSIDLTMLEIQSIIFYIFMMWIGGSSQSMAGGIKVNAFAVIVLNLLAILRGTGRVEAFGREITSDSVRRADATMVMSLGILFFSILLLSIMEPELSLLALIFECVSALSTTGASLNATSSLQDTSKILITILMFVGRIGLITLMQGLVKQKQNLKYRYPEEQIIIN